MSECVILRLNKDGTVATPGAAAPRYDGREIAQEEADAMSKRFPGETFLVFERVCGYRSELRTVMIA